MVDITIILWLIFITFMGVLQLWIIQMHGAFVHH